MGRAGRPAAAPRLWCGFSHAALDCALTHAHAHTTNAAGGFGKKEGGAKKVDLSGGMAIPLKKEKKEKPQKQQPAAAPGAQVRRRNTGGSGPMLDVQLWSIAGAVLQPARLPRVACSVTCHVLTRTRHNPTHTGRRRRPSAAAAGRRWAISPTCSHPRPFDSLTHLQLTAHTPAGGAARQRQRLGVCGQHRRPVHSGEAGAAGGARQRHEALRLQVWRQGAALLVTLAASKSCCH